MEFGNWEIKNGSSNKNGEQEPLNGELSIFSCHSDSIALSVLLDADIIKDLLKLPLSFLLMNKNTAIPKPSP
jgi:hypothetical protein